MDEWPRAGLRSLLDGDLDQTWRPEIERLGEAPLQGFRRSSPIAFHSERFRQLYKIRVGQIRADKAALIGLLLIAQNVAVGGVVEDNRNHVDAMMDGCRHFLQAEQKAAVAGDGNDCLVRIRNLDAERCIVAESEMVLI